MPYLAFMCTLSEGWDPFCNGDQLLMLVLGGAVLGAGLTHLALRATERRIALSIVLYAIGCLVGTVLVTIVGFQFSN